MGIESRCPLIRLVSLKTSLDILLPSQREMARFFLQMALVSGEKGKGREGEGKGRREKGRRGKGREGE